MSFNMRLPEKWTENTSFGDIIPGTNILITKTPLKEEYFAQSKYDSIEQFTPEILKQKVEEKFCKRVGLVVDLTFTNKYYHPLDMCKIAADYYKIAIEGHEVPDECFVQQLIRVIDSFNKFVKEGGNPDQFTVVEDTTPIPENCDIKETPSPPNDEEKMEEESVEKSTEELEKEKNEQEIIDEEKKKQQRIQRETDRLFSNIYPQNLPDISGCVSDMLSPAEVDSYSNEMVNSDFIIIIHCTHGVNRSGYMVARYLMDRFGLSGKEAIKRIQDARGTAFTRDHYVELLLDDEVLQMCRGQMKYWYVIDQQRYQKYTPGQRFQHAKFKAWKIAAKRKAEEPKDGDQPETKVIKDASEPESTDDTTTLA